MSDQELLDKINHVDEPQKEPTLGPIKPRINARDIAKATAITSVVGIIALEQMEPGTIAQTVDKLRREPLVTLGETLQTTTYAPRGIIEGTGEIASDVASGLGGYIVRGPARMITFQSLAACATNDCIVPTRDEIYAPPPRPLVAAESIMTAAVGITIAGMVINRTIGRRR